MKKKLLIVAVTLIVLLIAVVVAVGLSLDKLIKRAVETAGPIVTKVDVHLEDVKLSVLNGEGSLHGFALGNPAGYSSPTSIQFDLASLALQPSSVMSDKVIIRHVRLENPIITFEGGLKGNNLNDLLKGMQTGGESSPQEPTAPEEPEEEAVSRKLQVDEFALRGATLHAIVRELGGETNTFVLPDIVLRDLGTGPEGVTAAELSKIVLNEVAQVTLKTIVSSGGDLEKIGESGLKSLEDSGNEDAANAIRGAMDLFNKKKTE